MKVSVKTGKGCERILKVEVASEDVKKEYDAFYRSIAPKAKVPGFRPGKAPPSVLAIHYGQEAKKNVLNQLITQSYREALQEESLEPLGYPEIQDVDFSDTKLIYQAQIEVRPKIKLSKVTGLQAPKDEVTVKPEEVEESLKRIQKSQAQYKTVEDRPAEKGDFVVADYVCQAGTQEVDKRTEDWIQIQEEEYLKGFSIQLTGVKAGDEKEIKVILPEDFHHKEFASKESVFKVKVKEVKSEILPPLDDELAKSVGEFKSLEELKEGIQKELLHSKGHEVERAYEKALLDEFIKHNKIILPEGVVTRRLEKLVEDALGTYKRHGISEEKSEDLVKDLHKDLEPEARRQVHLAFLLDEVAQKENFSASPEDLKERYQKIAAQVRQPVEAVERYYQEQEEARLSLMEQIRSEKAIEFIKKGAKQK